MWTSSVLIVLAAAVLVSSHVPVPAHHFEDDSQTAQPLADDEPINYRLPNNTRPISYDIHLTTHIHTQENFNFTGVVAIRFTVLTASRSITVHQRQLTIGTASLVAVNNPTQPIALNAHQYDPVTELLTFPLQTEELIVDGVYILTINYAGIHRSDGGGFHRSSYVNADGSRRWLATTQLETTNARHAFPSYDEPGLRALFTVRITHGSIYSAVSNMPVISTTADANGYNTTQFQVTSATMPTYLVAFLVSDFEYKTATHSNGLVQRLFARPNAMQDADFGLDTGIKTLDALENYFGIPYTFPKLDQAAIPGKGGAMENWGLVTYGEQVLLYNDARSTFRDKENIATIIAHEYAHQWWGNLVVCKWWDHNWLNEGFATLFENYGVEWLFPEWKKLDVFVYDVVQSTFVSDATNSTRAMSHYVQTQAAISGNFGFVGYAKSGCVLRMMLNAFTEASFKKSLIGYLNNYANSVAIEDNLFDELEKSVKADATLSADYNVPTIFASWTRQAGFPIVDVTRNYANGDIVLHQERYLTVNESTQSPSIWWIPYNIARNGSANFESTNATAWFSTRSATIRENGLQNTDWLLLNKRQTGYYRVKYDLQNYKLLSEALLENHEQIHLTSRSQLIDDAFNLASTERLSYEVAFDFVKYLKNELEYVPWASAFRGLQYVDRQYAGSAEYNQFASYITKQLSNLYKDAGLTAKPTEHIWRKQARNQAIDWSCRLGDSTCLTETSSSLVAYLTNNVPIHQDHRAAVLCNGIRSANATHYALLVKKLISETDATEQNRFIDALACTSDTALTVLLLEGSVTVGETAYLSTANERYRAFSAVAGNGQNSTKVAIAFLTANLDRAQQQYGNANTNAAITRLADFAVGVERTKEFNDLLTAARTKEYIQATTITSAEAKLAANKRWIDRNELVIQEWIRKNGSAHVTVSFVLMAVVLLVSQLF